MEKHPDYQSSLNYAWYGVKDGQHYADLPDLFTPVAKPCGDKMGRVSTLMVTAVLTGMTER